MATIKLNGRVPSPKDNRDYKHKLPGWLKAFLWVPFLPDIFLPRKVDLRHRVLRVLHQGPMNACVVNAIAAAYQFVFLDSPPLSRLALFYHARSLEGNEARDCGTNLRCGLKALAKWGTIPEEQWPYDRTLLLKRPEMPSNNSVKVVYEAVENQLSVLKHTLAEGFPILFGFEVPDTFIKGMAGDGKWRGGSHKVGDHAALMVGYDDEKQHFIVLNSFGDQWGDDGYFYIPFDYVTRDVNVNEFWVLR